MSGGCLPHIFTLKHVDSLNLELLSEQDRFRPIQKLNFYLERTELKLY